MSDEPIDVAGLRARIQRLYAEALENVDDLKAGHTALGDALVEVINTQVTDDPVYLQMREQALTAVVECFAELQRLRTAIRGTTLTAYSLVSSLLQEDAERASDDLP